MPKKRKQPRKRPKPSVYQRRPGWVSHAFESRAATTGMLAMQYSTMDLAVTPICEGPLLIHSDGAFECHGEGCPGGMVAWHGSAALSPCHYAGALGAGTWRPCPDCERYADPEAPWSNPAAEADDDLDEDVAA